MEEFNPFDLSAAPKKPLEEKPAEPVAAKPTVKRVSMGPLFHSRITKVLALVLGTVLAFLIGYSATNYYLNERAAKEFNAAQITVDTRAS